MKWGKFINTIATAKNTIATAKNTIDNMDETIRSYFKVESIGDEINRGGIRAVFTGEDIGPIKLNAGPIKCSFQMENDGNSTFEIWQKDGKRGVTLRQPNSVTWEVDWEALHKFGTAKAAGLACAAGAAFGLLGWLGLTLAGRFLLKQEKIESEQRALVKSDSEQ